MEDTVAPKRLRSLDALRGFDMFWIIGGDELAGFLVKNSQNEAVRNVGIQFSQHVDWEGFRFYDMIFPLFLFIIGVTLPFSLERRMEQGDDKRALLRHILARTGILILLGLIYSGLFRLEGWENLRLFGVLQRQALGYCGAALLVLYTQPRTQAIVGVSILLAYWAMLALIPVPGFPPGTMTPEGNVANYVDRLILLKGQMYESYGDPEGALSTLPSIVTALLGAFTGRWLKSNTPDNKKLTNLVIAGVTCVALGLIWSPAFPIIKKIWTSSYMLVAGGCSILLLALFYWIIDVKGRWRWSYPFIVIGVNPILIYMLSAIVDFGAIANFFVGGLGKHYPDAHEILTIVGLLTVKWLLLHFLYKQKVFVKV